MLVAKAVGGIRLPAEMLPVSPVVTEKSGICSDPHEAERILHQRINRSYGPLPYSHGGETSRKRIMFRG